MNNNIVVPALGESISEATVSKWLKKKGESVKVDEPIVELETDKVNVEVPSPAEGIISKINYNNGDTVKVGALLGSISGEKKEVHSENKEEENKVDPEEKIVPITKSKKIQEKEKPKIKKNPKNEKKEQFSIFKEEEESKEIEQPLILGKPLILKQEAQSQSKNIRIENDSSPLSPAVRKIVQENKIDIQDVKGTGKGGRVLKGDLIDLMSKSPNPSERKIKYGSEEIIKMTRLRLTIAKRLKEAQENAAMLTTFNEVDMNNIIEMRKDYQEDFQKKFSIKLGFMSFFVKASIVGLKNFPAINAEINGENIVYKNYYNIGFAVGTDRGLVVPVLKNADEMSFAEIEKNIKVISDKARDGKLAIQDLQGGTFTISNGGVYGSMLSTPILNPPQSGVLGMHNIVNRPVVLNEEIVSRPVMYLALSYDHRIVDGKDSVAFLKCIKEHLEEPRRLFLQL
tara:strand:+ start:161 stop:1525 length:1365 start_codon:yes stop_codon:yes gene_type:complete